MSETFLATWRKLEEKIARGRESARQRVAATRAAWTPEELDRRREADRERARESFDVRKNWRQENKEKVKADRKAWRKTAAGKLSQRMYRAKRRAALRAADVGAFGSREWRAAIDAFENRCAYCKKPMRRPTLDHFHPLAKGGTHLVHNIVPACKDCNGRKTASDPFAFLHDIRAQAAPA